jgi:hypothetical protein
MKGENGDSRGDKELMAFADKSRYIGNFLKEMIIGRTVELATLTASLKKFFWRLLYSQQVLKNFFGVCCAHSKYSEAGSIKRYFNKNINDKIMKTNSIDKIYWALGAVFAGIYFWIIYQNTYNIPLWVGCSKSSFHFPKNN